MKQLVGKPLLAMTAFFLTFQFAQAGTGTKAVQMMNLAISKKLEQRGWKVLAAEVDGSSIRVKAENGKSLLKHDLETGQIRAVEFETNLIKPDKSTKYGLTAAERKRDQLMPIPENIPETRFGEKGYAPLEFSYLASKKPVQATGEYKHKIMTIPPNSLSASAWETKVKIELFVQTSQTVTSRGGTVITTRADLTRLMTVPGEIKYQEILTERGHNIYRVIYRDEQGALLERHYLIEAESPKPRPLGTARTIVDTNQFVIRDLQETSRNLGEKTVL